MRHCAIKIIFTVLLLIIESGCSKTLYPSRWQQGYVVADGDASEWTIPLQYYDNNTKLNYAFSNDAKNLYLCVRVGDDHEQMIILRSGLTVWLDKEGKENKTTGITYPLPRSMMVKQSQIHTEEKQKPDLPEAKRQFSLKQNQVLLRGFRNVNGLSPLQNKEGINVALSWDSSGAMIYEAVVPFKTFFKDAVSTSDTLSTWTVGFEIREGMGGEGGHRGGGMQPRVGFGMGSGGGGAVGVDIPIGGGGGQGGPIPKEVWTKIRLAFRQSY